MPVDTPFIIKYKSFIVQPVDAVVNEHVHKTKVDKVKYIRAFTQQLGKWCGQHFFHYRGFRDQTIKEGGDGYGQQIVIDDNAERVVQACRPARGYGEQWHEPYAKEYEKETDIRVFEFIGAMKAFAADHQRQFDADEKFKATPKEGVEHHEGKIVEKAVPVDVTEDKHY